MKDFFRTVFGKTLLFIICAVSLTALAFSAAGALFYNFYENGKFYKESERAIFEDATEYLKYNAASVGVGGLLSKVNAAIDEKRPAAPALPSPKTAPAVKPSTEREEWPIPTGAPENKPESLKAAPRSDEAEIVRVLGSADALSKDEGNIIYRISVYKGAELLASESAGSVVKWEQSCYFPVFKTEEGRYVARGFQKDEPAAEDSGKLFFQADLSLNEKLGANDRISAVKSLLHLAYTLRYTVYWVLGLSFLLSVLSFSGLMTVSARRPGSAELFPGFLNFVPFDIMLISACLPLFFGLELADGGRIGLEESIAGVAVFGAAFFLGASLFLGLCMSFAARIKQKTLIKNSFIYICLRFIWKALRGAFRLLMSLIRNLPLVWKTAVLVCGISLLELIFLAGLGVGIARGGKELLALFFLEKLVIIPAALYFAVMLKRLKKCGEALAGGNLGHVTDTKGMIWELKEHGENLNSAALGISKAVDERTKSERMKTELITNVSHDIKTPLTSIINYTMLIGEEKTENEKIAEYSAVLLRQSERLKRLIDDLVEASKAQSGNLEVNLSQCEASIFITQAAGEYEEKLRAAELTLVTKMPEKELIILADGRRMLRIFDNLMSNIVKYALSGTRVYLSLEEENGEAVMSFKNTSRERLDMEPAELMERFTRGDSSRSGEGNGLGLAIARSMTELQGGRLEISSDGDLFKAQLRFPLVKTGR